MYSLIARLTPSRPVHCLRLKLVCRHATQLQTCFESILVALTLSTLRSRAMGQLAKEDLLGDTRVVHAYHMTYTSQLGYNHVSLNALDTAAREDLRVGDLVLPFDMGNLPKASHVELIEIFDVTTI